MILNSINRTIKYLREEGCICGNVEKYNQYSKKKNDLFGFIDIICIEPGVGVVAVQACGSDYRTHIEKMLGERNENMYEWLKYNRVKLYGWRKLKLKRGGKARRWYPRIAEFFLEDDEIKMIEIK